MIKSFSVLYHHGTLYTLFSTCVTGGPQTSLDVHTVSSYMFYPSGLKAFVSSTETGQPAAGSVTYHSHRSGTIQKL